MQQESSSRSLHAGQHTEERLCFIEWFVMGWGGWETMSRGSLKTKWHLRLQISLTSVCFVAITHQVGTTILRGPQQQSLCCLFFCVCKVFPGIFAKPFELRGTKAAVALGVELLQTGGQMPEVFVASPVVALRSLPTDPTDNKLYCLVLIMQDTARTVTPRPCFCSKLAGQHRKRAALG